MMRTSFELMKGLAQASRKPKLLTNDPFFRPQEWHIALVRDSLMRAVYPETSHHHVQHFLRQKAERKIGKQISFRKHVSQQYGLLGDDRQVNTNCLWNMASADWEPTLPRYNNHKEPSGDIGVTGAAQVELKAGLLQAAHIVPQCFGKKMFRRIFGDHHKDEAFWAPGNGLLLPRGIASAMDEWSISVVPDLPDDDPQPGCVQQWMSSYPVQDFKFRVIDPTDENLSRRITFVKGDYRTGCDLHGTKLAFPKPFRPKLIYLYFNHCCTIVKKNRGLFQDAATDWSVINFRNAEQERMKLEGGVGEGQHRPFTREYCLQAFWRGMLKDLARIEKDPRGVMLDWTMGLRYLEKVPQPSETVDNTKDMEKITLPGS
ncbi:hypothetical protein F4810DRAFT_692555 [Camillea tinctor]|nr:hypothetical protein F4810DRAFT_692555 [Camillea tinctor]